MAGRTIKQLEHALRATAGNITQAAGALGMTRYGLQKRVSASPVLQQVVTDERESLADIAESQLRIALNNGDMTAIIWTLKASPAAKKRGWGERQELTDGEGKPVAIAIVKMPVDEL